MSQQSLPEKLFKKRKDLLKRKKIIDSHILEIENELRIITRPWMNIIKSNKKIRIAIMQQKFIIT